MNWSEGDDTITFPRWAQLAALGLDPERAPTAADWPAYFLAREILLEELAPATAGELAGAPRYLEGAMPSRLRDGVISLLYALFLPAWCHLGREDGPLILSGDDTTRGIAFQGICGPPAQRGSPSRPSSASRTSPAPGSWTSTASGGSSSRP